MDINDKIDIYLNESKIKDWFYDSIANLFYKVVDDKKIEVLLNGVKGKSSDRTMKGKVRVQWSDYKEHGLTKVYQKHIDFVPDSINNKDIIYYIDKNLKTLEKKAKRGGSIIEAKISFNNRQIEYVANSLTDKEWFVLGIFIGFKSKARKDELEYWAEQYNIPITVQEYNKIVNSLYDKKAIGKGRIEPQSRKIWEFKFSNKLPSQVPHWIKYLKF